MRQGRARGSNGFAREETAGRAESGQGAGLGPEVLLCPDAFTKCEYLERLARQSDRGVIYLDFDMLYSGYTQSGIVGLPDGVVVRRPGPEDWQEELVGIVRTVSAGSYLVLVDSLNGMMTMFGGREAGHQALRSIMIIRSLGREAGTRVVAAAVLKNTSDGLEPLLGCPVPAATTRILPPYHTGGALGP